MPESLENTVRYCRLVGFKRSHIDRESVFHVLLYESVVGLVDLLDGDDFDVGGYIVLAAEVEHLLGLGDASNERAREAATAEDEVEGSDWHRLLRYPDECEVSVAAQQAEQRVDVMISGDAVKDEVEAGGVLCHLVRVAGDHNFIGPKAQCVVPLVGRRGEENDMGSEGMSEFDSHMAEPAEPDDADLLALRDSPVM